jgi:hypothetical protein
VAAQKLLWPTCASDSVVVCADRGSTDFSFDFECTVFSIEGARATNRGAIRWRWGGKELHSQP